MTPEEEEELAKDIEANLSKLESLEKERENM